MAAPDDVDLHAYLAVWQRFSGNESESGWHMEKLESLNKGKQKTSNAFLHGRTRIRNTVERVCG